MTLVDEAYAEIAELPLEFDRQDIEGILFERAMKQLENEKQEINQRTIKGRYYSLLSHLILSLNNYNFRKDRSYKLTPVRERCAVGISSVQKWTPDK